MTIFLEKYREPLCNRMSLLSLIAFFGFHIFGKVLANIFNINETMGWKWSVSPTWIDSVPIFSISIFFIIYLILNLLKIKTNLMLSAFHLSLIALIAFLFNFWELDLRITLFFICFSFMIFGMNLYNALVNIKSN